jgi:hypothetical protein
VCGGASWSTKFPKQNSPNKIPYNPVSVKCIQLFRISFMNNIPVSIEGVYLKSLVPKCINYCSDHLDFMSQNPKKCSNALVMYKIENFDLLRYRPQKWIAIWNQTLYLSRHVPPLNDEITIPTIDMLR